MKRKVKVVTYHLDAILLMLFLCALASEVLSKLFEEISVLQLLIGGLTGGLICYTMRSWLWTEEEEGEK